MSGPRPHHPPASLTVPLDGGSATVAKGVLRGKATLRFSRRGNVIEVYADVLQMGDLIDALVARRSTMVKDDQTGDRAVVEDC